MVKSKVEHGSAKAPATKLSTGKAPAMTSDAVPRHKLIAMGKHPEVSSGGAKTRP